MLLKDKIYQTWVCTERNRTEACHRSVEAETYIIFRTDTDAYMARDATLEDNVESEQRAAVVDTLVNYVRELFLSKNNALGEGLTSICRSYLGAPVAVVSVSDSFEAAVLFGTAGTPPVEFVVVFGL